MKRRTILLSALITLLLPPVLAAQSTAYAKFGPRGETIGLFNLMKDPGSCGSWKVFNGTVTSVVSEKHDEKRSYRLTLHTGGRLYLFRFTLHVDEIPRSDIEDLVAKKRAVKVRACESRSRWIAEEIVRIETARSDAEPTRLDPLSAIDRSQ